MGRPPIRKHAMTDAQRQARRRAKLRRERKVEERSEKQASKAKITERAIERLEARAVDKPWEGWQLDLVFGTGARSGAVVARLDGAVVHRGSFTLGPLDLEIEWQERLAIVIEMVPSECLNSEPVALISASRPNSVLPRCRLYPPWIPPAMPFMPSEPSKSEMPSEPQALPRCPPK